MHTRIALQKDSIVPIEVMDVDMDESHAVDAKLVQLARKIHAPILTNDYNLNRVAELQGVLVLNINELANSLIDSPTCPGVVIASPERELDLVGPGTRRVSTVTKSLSENRLM